MFLPPRLGNRKPATPGISSRSQRTSALPSALGTLVRYTVADASGDAARPREEAGGLGGLGLGDDVEGSDASGAEPEPEPEPETMRSTRPMAPSTRRTFIPCGWCLELVRNSRTTPRVSRPVL